MKNQIPLTDFEARALGALIHESLLAGSDRVEFPAWHLACCRLWEADTHRPSAADLAACAAMLVERGLVMTTPVRAADLASYLPIVHECFDLDPAQTAALALLMINGPQTAAELAVTSQRLYPFRDRFAAYATLESLEHADGTPLAERERASAPAMEARFRHTLSAHVPAVPERNADPPAPRQAPRDDDLEHKLAELDTLVGRLARRS